MRNLTLRRRLPALLLLALAAVAVALLAVAPSTRLSNAALAATPTPNCGANFRTISSYDRGHGVSTLRFRDSDRMACFTFRKTKNVGTATDTGVRMYRPLGNVTKRDRGQFEYYAGPIYMHIPARYDDPSCKLNTWYLNAQGEWRQHGYYICAAF